VIDLIPKYLQIPVLLVIIMMPYWYVSLYLFHTKLFNSQYAKPSVRWSICFCLSVSWNAILSVLIGVSLLLKKDLDINIVYFFIAILTFFAFPLFIYFNYKKWKLDFECFVITSFLPLGVVPFAFISLRCLSAFFGFLHWW